MSTVNFDNSAVQGRHPLRADAPSGAVAEPAIESRWPAALVRLGSREFYRRVCHILPGFLPLLLWPIPHDDPVSPKLGAIVIGICGALGLAIMLQYRRIARRGDGGPVSCVLGYAGSIIAAVLLFPSALEIAFAVLAILAFGDGSATLFGNMIRSRPLPWNPRKSWSGFVAFIAVGLPMTALIYWGESHNLDAVQPGVPFGIAILCVSLAVVASAVAESLPWRVNDNIRVGIVSLVCLAAAQTAFVGW